MSEMTDAYVKLDKVSKIYGTKEVKIVAVDEISFEIAKGEFVVIVGPSGAGKTTVLNILGGMDQATSGEVLVDGRNIARYNSRQLTGYRRNDIGFVFQFYNLVPNLTALENVELALQICKNPLPDRTSARIPYPAFSVSCKHRTCQNDRRTHSACIDCRNFCSVCAGTIQIKIMIVPPGHCTKTFQNLFHTENI